MSQIKWACLVWMVAGFLTACGGGNDESKLARQDNDNPAGAPTFNGAPAAYHGTISGLGSIVVNGVRFETIGAVVDDGDDFSAGYQRSASTFNSPLALGMTVALFGDVDDSQSLGRAARIRVVGGVRGTLLAVDTQALTLTLPTQTVQLSAATSYGGTTDGTSAGSPVTNLTQLATLTGNKPLLTVYGLPQADGGFLATRVVVSHASAHAMDVAVRGTITAITPAANDGAGVRSYTVKTGVTSSLTIRCDPCTIQPAGSTPDIGDVVRALAADASQWSANTRTLTAARLQLVNASYLTRFDDSPSAASYAKIKGVATGDGGTWKVGGVEVRGATLTAGTWYEIKGTWLGSVLIATRVEVESARSFADRDGVSRNYVNEFYGAVSNLSGNRFTVQGVTVDAGSAYFPYGSAASLRNDAFVEVKGNYVDGKLLATKVEIKAATGSNASAGRVFEIYGQVSNWSDVGSVFDLLTRGGVAYRAQTSVNTRREHGAPVNGSYVEAKGYMDASNVFQVIKLEVKNGYSDHDD